MRRKTLNKQRLNLNLKSVRVYVLGTICGILAVACIFMTIQTATTGSEIAALQTKESQLVIKQQELQEQLVQSLSVNKLQEQSSTLGFTKVGNLVYVTDTTPVAARLP